MKSKEKPGDMKQQRDFDALYKLPDIEVIQNSAIHTPKELDRLNTLLNRILKQNEKWDTDSKIAENWKEYHQGDFIYNHTSSDWYKWNGSYWQKDTRKEVYESVKTFADWLWHNTQDRKLPADSSEVDRAMKISRKLYNMRGIESCLAAAQSIPAISTTEEDFDVNPDLLNFTNGTYDLSTHLFREHNKEDRLTKSLSFAFDTDNVLKPNFDQFISQIFKGNQDLIRFVFEYLSMCLTGRVTEQVFLFWYGTGANGKSVLSETMTQLLSCYAAKIEFAVLLDTSSSDKSQQEKARLKGIRLAIASEVAEGKYLNEQLIKDLISNDTLTARELYSKTFQFYPTHHLIISGNHKPRIKGTDEGIRRRVYLIPFSFTVPKQDQIPSEVLLNSFRPEFPAIINYLIGSYKTIQDNNGKFTSVPEIVSTYTKDYFLEMDVIANWLSECCIILPEMDTPSKTLYANYSTWMKENGNHPSSKTAFSRKLQEYIASNSLDITQYRGHGNNLRFSGIGLLPDEDNA